MGTPAPITARKKAGAALPAGMRGWSPAGPTRVSAGYVPAPLKGMPPEVLRAALAALAAAEQAGLPLALPDHGGVPPPADQPGPVRAPAQQPDPAPPPAPR